MKQSNRDGGALFVTLVIVFTITALLGTVIKAGMQRSYMARLLANRARAIAIAEAGANKAYATLLEDMNYHTNPAVFPMNLDYGRGSFHVNVTAPSERVRLICSTGICEQAVVVVALDCKDYGIDWDWYRDEDIWNFPIASGGSVTLGGGGIFTTDIDGDDVADGGIYSLDPLVVGGGMDIVANVESSSKTTLNGDIDIIGDLTAPAARLNGGASVSETLTLREVPPRLIPDIDLTPYYIEASKTGTVIEGNVKFNAANPLVVPPGGIIWVNGDVEIQEDYTGEVTIIATGDIAVNAQGTYRPFSTYPALASINGDITINGGANFLANDTDGDGVEDHGSLIYARTGSIDKQGGGDVTGVVMAQGDVTRGGAWTYIGFMDSIPTPPDADAADGENLVPSAWQQ